MSRKKKEVLKLEVEKLTLEQAINLVKKYYENNIYFNEVGYEAMIEEVKAELTILQKLEDAFAFFNNLKEEYNTAFNTVNEIDKEINDIRHQIELMEEPTQKDKVKWFDELRAAERERRIYKDIVMQLEPTLKFLTDTQNSKMLSYMSKALGETRKIAQHCETRTYRTRIRTDLTIGRKED